MTLNTRGLQTFAADIGKAVDAGVQQTAEAIAQEAQRLVPVDTGALRTSIEVFGAGGSGARTVEAGQGLDYAAFVEYGTAKAPAQPFMTPAAARHRADLPKNIAAQLKALEKRSRI